MLQKNKGAEREREIKTLYLFLFRRGLISRLGACVARMIQAPLTTENQRMSTAPLAPLRPTRHAKRCRNEPVRLEEPELEAAAARSARKTLEAALRCHETEIETCLETCTNLLVDGDGAVRLCTNARPSSSQVCKTCTGKLARLCV